MFRMIPIEQASTGMVVFLECGCAAARWITHRTGAAALVRILQPCDTNRGITDLSVSRGTLVSPYVRKPVGLDERQHRDLV